eukprot:CAMPEP_0170527246 /NCGR_PEP_ID=MMETSP0209-20121228/12717_1 /TAXON_ID=665100 ORGANISM="Litonotus pictus, Strain P1" /NCGR_SAMPLE_ID=MMETSP0209 /ASSEMBLY_ACC=CAM_ASM_000301 /LENGTH=167 /DNA_ID=CAMNT_0010817647 /DNA_START=488 /DNA_END=988 /DNA_ORIENTATION=-
MIASSGKIVMLRLKKVINEYLNMTSVESFEAQTTDLNAKDFHKEWGNNNSTVVIAMSYQNLSVMIIRELPPYRILSFLSETGGIIGLLLGSSFINLAISVVQWLWGLRVNESRWFSIKSEVDPEKLRLISNSHINSNCDKNTRFTMDEPGETDEGNNMHTASSNLVD